MRFCVNPKRWKKRKLAGELNLNSLTVIIVAIKKYIKNRNLWIPQFEFSAINSNNSDCLLAV